MWISKFLIFSFVCTTGCIHTYGQKTLSEKLGYPKDARLLIIHADDAGLSHSQDSATITALGKKAVNSAAIMAPCPWFPEIAAYAKQHPEMDWGIHITLTSEWKNYKWSGVSSSNEIASLLDKDGYMYATLQDFNKNEKPAEVEKEVKAQIEKALSFGIRLTHIDTHMGSVLGSPELVKMYQQVGKQYRLPVLIPMNFIRMIAPKLIDDIDTANVSIVNNYAIATPGISADKWKQFYNNVIEKLKPGLNELVFHLAFDDNECKAITIGQADYGAAWRQRDFNYATSEEFKALLKKENVQLVTWGEIQKIMYGQK